MADAEVSVVVPVYNGERYLAEAVASIRRQGSATIQLIIVDDGSTDGTAAIAQSFDSIRYVRVDNGGPAAARNIGLDLARAEFIAFLDADDIWADNRLNLQLQMFAADPQLELVTGHTQCLMLQPSGAWVPWQSPRSLPLFGVILARRSVFERVGRLDETLRVAEDVDWFIRAREAGVKTLSLPEVLLYYRLHGNNLTQGWQPQQAGYVRAIRKMLDKRRGSGPA